METITNKKFHTIKVEPNFFKNVDINLIATQYLNILFLELTQQRDFIINSSLGKTIRKLMVIMKQKLLVFYTSLFFQLNT